MSLVSSLNIAQQALAVNQAAITVVSNNIANVNNENYSKLKVNLSDIINYTKLTGSSIAQAETLSGVQLSKITRFADEFLESYYRGENSELSYLKEYSTIATSVQDIMNELNDTGLTNALLNFYNAANALADDPTDVTTRQNYVSCAQTVCTTFNTVYKSLTQIQQSLVGDYTINGDCDSAEIGTSITQVNSLLDQLSKVNTNIVKTNSTSTSSNALLDQRDALLEELSTYLPIKTEINASGTVNIKLGNYDLIKGNVVKGYLDVTNQGATADNPVRIDIVDAEGTPLRENVNNLLNSGTIGAILTASGPSTSINLTVNNVLASINLLASTFAEQLNSLQAGAKVIDGVNTYAMCLSDDYTELVASNESLFLNNNSGTASGITAGNISVNSELEEKLYLIAAGRKTNPADSSDVGNNSNMVQVANTQTNSYLILDNQTFTNYLATKVSGIGTNVESIDNNVATQSSVLDSIKAQLASETGVNLDEELGDLIKYQQAYQAAARIFSTCSSLMEELIHLAQ